MNLKQLEYLVKTVEVGNMTQAAKSLYISQPSLSNAIKELESEMNVTILNRSQKGVTLTVDGEEFLRYAHQVLEQVELMRQRYHESSRPKQIFSVAAQHYAFVVDAFVHLLSEIDQDYQAALKELRTYEVIDEVANLQSEIGVIYRSHYNYHVITNTLKEKQLTFTPLFEAKPHVFVDKNHPLVGRKQIALDDLLPYPKLSYEQGTHNSLYFFEEVLADQFSPKQIIVSDRASLFNLLIDLNGYTISSGIINEDLNGSNIIAIPLICDEVIELGYITNDLHRLNPIALDYLALLKESIARYGAKDNNINEDVSNH